MYYVLEERIVMHLQLCKRKENVASEWNKQACDRLTASVGGRPQPTNFCSIKAAGCTTYTTPLRNDGDEDDMLRAGTDNAVWQATTHDSLQLIGLDLLQPCAPHHLEMETLHAQEWKILCGVMLL
jgi:hypothetical protein